MRQKGGPTSKCQTLSSLPESSPVDSSTTGAALPRDWHYRTCPRSCGNTCVSLPTAVAKAQVWGWQQAARVKTRELLNGLDDLQHAVNQLIGELQDRLQSLPVASPGRTVRRPRGAGTRTVRGPDRPGSTPAVRDDRTDRARRNPPGPLRNPLGLAAPRTPLVVTGSWRWSRIQRPPTTRSRIRTSTTRSSVKGMGGRALRTRWRPDGSTTFLRSSIVCCTRTRRAEPTWSSTSGTESPATIAAASSMKRKTTPAVAVRRRSVRIARAVARTAISPAVPAAAIPADCVTSRPVVLVWSAVRNATAWCVPIA